MTQKLHPDIQKAIKGIMAYIKDANIPYVEKHIEGVLNFTFSKYLSLPTGEESTVYTEPYSSEPSKEKKIDSVKYCTDKPTKIEKMSAKYWNDNRMSNLMITNKIWETVNDIVDSHNAFMDTINTQQEQIDILLGKK